VDTGKNYGTLFLFVQYAANMEKKQNQDEIKKLTGNVVHYGMVIQVGVSLLSSCDIDNVHSCSTSRATSS